MKFKFSLKLIFHLSILILYVAAFNPVRIIQDPKFVSRNYHSPTKLNQIDPATGMVVSINSPIFRNYQIPMISTIFYTLFIRNGAAGISIKKSVLDMMRIAPTLATLQVLKSAAHRQRLDGNTFRLLNLGYSLSFIWTWLKITIIGGGGGAAVGAGGFAFKKYLPEITAFIASTMNVFEYGLPKHRIQINNKSPLALSYLACATHRVACMIKNAAITPCSNNLLIAFIFLALHGAANVGQKRLSSETYKTLNIGIIFGSIFGSILSPTRQSMWTIMNVMICSFGLYKGITYSE